MTESVGMSVLEQDHGRFMAAALQQAQIAMEADEVPVGAVIVYKNQIIARAHNQRETLNDPTAHAEMIALTQAASFRESWHLEGCTMYVTLEPCPMCAGALVLARIDRLVYGPKDPKAGACETLYNITEDERLNHQIEVISGFLEEPCKAILQEFFARKRLAKNKPKPE
jgi:tRNA(adenine34) deaminase